MGAITYGPNSFADANTNRARSLYHDFRPQMFIMVGQTKTWRTASQAPLIMSIELESSSLELQLVSLKLLFIELLSSCLELPLARLDLL